jgi:hypothetical protein
MDLIQLSLLQQMEKLIHKSNYVDFPLFYYKNKIFINIINFRIFKFYILITFHDRNLLLALKFTLYLYNLE